MGRKRKILTVLALLFILLYQNSEVCYGAATYWPTGIEVASKSAIVIDVKTGTILYEKNIDEQLYPASITKILTGLVAVENSNLDEIVTFSEDAVLKNEGDASNISRDIGEKMTMEQCLYGMMLESANECAYAIGEHIGKNEKNFVEMMNSKAKELGCTNSHFNNTNGLPDEKHYTTARDMAYISRAAFLNEELADIISTKSYLIGPTNKHDVNTPLNNHHAMLHSYKTTEFLYEGCLGGKTGFTDAANSTLVTYAKRDGMTLACVVMNVTAPGQYKDTIALLDYCFSNFSSHSVSEVKTEAILGEAEKEGYFKNRDLIYTDKNATIVLPKTANVDEVSCKIIPYNGEEKEVVAVLKYLYGDREVGTGNLIYTTAKEYDYPFHNLEKEKGEAFYIRIDLLKIIKIVGIIILLIALGIFIQQKSSKWHLYQHRRKANKSNKKSNYKKIKTNKKRRKRHKKSKNDMYI